MVETSIPDMIDDQLDEFVFSQGSIVFDLLLARGYAGGLSIEPHLAVVFHDSTVTSPDAVRYANYVEYGRRMMKMADGIRAELKQAK